MTPAKPALEELSGYLGVGSLQLLGLFLLVDGATNLYILVEMYVKSNTFAILFTVPLLVISYVLGLLSSLGAEAILRRWIQPKLTAQLYAEVLQLKSEALIQRFNDVERHSRLLYGCTIAFVLLGVGSYAEIPNMSGFTSVGYICLGAGLAISALCPFLAIKLQNDMQEFVYATRVSHPSKDA